MSDSLHWMEVTTERVHVIELKFRLGHIKGNTAAISE